MKVLVADLFSQEGIKDLKEAGMEVVYDQSLNADSLTKSLNEN